MSSVSYLVEASSGNTTAQLRSSEPSTLTRCRRAKLAYVSHAVHTGTLTVDALRVRLGAIGLTSSVQRDDLVANNVVTRRKVGNSKIPGKVVFNEIISSPGAGVAS